MKAPRADQLILLQVADLDAQLNRLERENTQHPLRASLGKLLNAIAARGREKTAAETQLEQARAELASVEKTSADLARQVADKEEKYNAGTGLTSRDLLVLEDEMAALRTTLEETSEKEFAALEAVEGGEERVRELGAAIDSLQEKVLAQRSELEDVVADITASQEKIRAQREELYAPLAASLKKVYEHSVATGGYAVMTMTPNGATGAGITLSPVEVAQIKATPEDEIYLSEDYDCIIVPVDYDEA